MLANVQDRCQLLVTNREAIKRAFSWDGATIHLCVASMYTLQGVTVDADRLHSCKDMIRRTVGPFNNFRSTSHLALAAMMDLSGDPQTILDRALTVYDMLKTHFATNSYLPMAAMTIARHVPVSHYDEVCSATRAIYNLIKKEHPFLTSGEDCTCCTLMALSGMDHQVLLRDMEASFAVLKSAFFSGNAVQTLSHALALYPGDPVVKAQRTLDLFRELKSRGQRWDTSYALPLLGVIAMTSNDQQAILSEVLDASDWLKTQPGFGFWSSIGSPMRLMYAGMMVNSAIAADSNTNLTSMLTSSIITLIAQQAAMSAAIATNTATH